GQRRDPAVQLRGDRVSESAIPAVEAAFLAQLEGHTDGAPLGEGKPEPTPDEYVALWEVESETEVGSLGQQKLREDIDLQVVVEVIRASANDFAPSRERAQAIAAHVEARFREDLTLGRVWLFGRISKRRQQYFRTDKQRGCRIFLTFSGSAEI